MQYNGLLYKHIHPALISKELFDECQRVRMGKRKMKAKRREKAILSQVENVLAGMKIPESVLIE
jgi:hypothetical protein